MDPDPSSLFIFLTFGSAQIISLVILVLLLGCSALVSGSEVALFSLTPSDFQTDNGKYSNQQEILIRLLDKPKRLLATILVANNFFNIAAILLLGSLGDDLLGDVHIVFWGIKLRFMLEVVVATFLILLFGEILPKIYANRNKVAFSHLMAYPLNVLDKLLSFFSIPMGNFTQLIHNHLGKKSTGLSVDQLSQALELTDEHDTTQQEQKILQGIVSFGNTETKQVMRPRMDIFALNLNRTYAEIVPEIIDRGYSRVPIYEESLDDVKGILYIKDLLPHLDEEDFEWQSLLREPYFVPENKKLDDLLNEFKDKKNHLAIVVDEYGGTSGLLSLEDIIEEIVGDISDEFDDEDLIFSKLDENTFIFEGKTSLKDFYKIIKLEDSSAFEENKGDSETVAGFLLEISGNFPKKDEKITFETYTFTIEAVDQKRIKQVKFSRK